jgi:thiosulfate/3-mercaptopyruvate sulfurtransferase
MTLTDDPKTLVSTAWLAAHRSDPDLRVIDASWYLPDMGRDAKAEYKAAHIPGARFFDIDEITDSRSNLPHMAPPPEKFVSRMRAMGIGDGHQVVVYDGAGLFSAARVWWTFRLMGKSDVAVLDGGFPKWQAEGREVEDMPPVLRDRHITVSRQHGLVKDVTQVAHAAKLLNPDGTMKPVADLRAVFEAAGVNLSKPAITSCGSGVTAAILSLALERMGHKNHALYDGSWAEWGMYEDLAVEKG